MPAPSRITKNFLIILTVHLFTFTAGTLSFPGPAKTAGQTDREISIEWRKGGPEGRILVTDGSIYEIKTARGQGTVHGKEFTSSGASSFRLDVAVKGSGKRYGAGSTVITVDTRTNPFSFFLRDVDTKYPIFISEYGVIVSDSSDRRTYQEIEAAIRSQGKLSRLQRIESEAEESFEVAARETKALRGPTWLGLSRDFRIFEINQRLDTVQPRFADSQVTLPETEGHPVTYEFLMGRGWGPVEKISRRLDEGALPILQGTLLDDDIHYRLTMFVSLEWSELSGQTLRGTHFLVADGHSHGHRFTQEQEQQFGSLLPEELNRAEETVLYARVEALNTASVPRYAWFRNIVPTAEQAPKWHFDEENGFGIYESGRIFSVSKLEGQPLRSCQ